MSKMGAAHNTMNSHVRTRRLFAAMLFAALLALLSVCVSVGLATIVAMVLCGKWGLLGFAGIATAVLTLLFVPSWNGPDVFAEVEGK